MLVAEPNGSLNLGGRPGESHERRENAVAGEAVALVRLQLLRLADHAVRAQRGDHRRREPVGRAHAVAPSASGFSAFAGVRLSRRDRAQRLDAEHPHGFPCLPRGAAEMRGENDVGKQQQPGMHLGLPLVHVEGGARDPLR